MSKSGRYGSVYLPYFAAKIELLPVCPGRGGSIGVFWFCRRKKWESKAGRAFSASDDAANLSGLYWELFFCRFGGYNKGYGGRCGQGKTACEGSTPAGSAAGGLLRERFENVIWQILPRRKLLLPDWTADCSLSACFGRFCLAGNFYGKRKDKRASAAERCRMRPGKYRKGKR